MKLRRFGAGAPPGPRLNVPSGTLGAAHSASLVPRCARDTGPLGLRELLEGAPAPHSALSKKRPTGRLGLAPGPARGWSSTGLAQAERAEIPSEARRPSRGRARPSGRANFLAGEIEPVPERTTPESGAPGPRRVVAPKAGVGQRGPAL